jgi:hypothetical protein
MEEIYGPDPVQVGAAGLCTTAAPQLPFELFRGPCPNTSNGQPCRYYADHEPYQHTYGGGLCDPVRNRHCEQPERHVSHAWTTDDRAWFNCGGSALVRSTDASNGGRRPG